MSRKIRILHLIDTLGSGGAEALLRTFAAGIDRERFQLYVAGMRPLRQSPLREELRALGVPTHEFNQHNSYDLPALLSIVRYIKRHRIDIIHTHLLAADIMGRMAGFLTRRPVVSTVHVERADLDLEPRRRAFMQRWTARLMCRTLIVVSDVIRGEVADWFGLTQSRVVVIPNGVDTERFYRAPDYDRAAMKQALLGGEHPLVTNVARLVPEKGQSYLLQAAQLIAQGRPDVRFLLLGDGPLRKALEAQATDLGIADKVIFAGFRNDVADVLGASDVFVLSSVREGMPVALLEAMAAGVPAVATDVGGVAQVLKHEENGLMVPPADPSKLASAICRYLGDPAYARRMADSARASVNERYGMRAWASKCEALYLSELRTRK
jgi:glycosyltransferase involved in cell wall biosynthesis